MIEGFEQTKRERSGSPHLGFSEFKAVNVNLVYIPGLPIDGLICERAENQGLKMPRYSRHEVARFFLQRDPTRLMRILNSVKHPDESDPFWFPRITSVDSRRRIWTLADVERMIHYLHTRAGKLDHDQFICSLMLVLWVAKGRRIYV